MEAGITNCSYRSLTDCLVDSTFLLTFSTTLPNHPYPTADGNFTVLLDPWLSGDSAIFHPKFALAKHTVPACIQHLSEISPPNVIVISQDKTDHCHEGTLKQLDAGLSHTVILAQPAAAKRIRSWKYFNPNKVHAFPLFSDKKGNTIIRFQIPSTNPGSVPGEATLAFIGAKFDIAGVHNAIAITYRPPAAAPLIASPLPSPAFPSLRNHVSALELPLQGAMNSTFPPTPPSSSPTSSNQSFGSPTRPRRSSTPDPAPLLSPNAVRGLAPSQSHPQAPSNHHHTRSNSYQNFSRPFSHSRQASRETEADDSESDSGISEESRPRSSTDTPPTSPAWTNISSSTRSYTPFRPKTLSVIYSPHGLSYQAIRSYVTSHLIHNAALPLTLLLHSFDRISNPWYLGGNVNAGSPGGLEIARNLLAKCWISAHDEDKESTGVAVLKAVTRKYTACEVADLLECGNNSKSDRRGGNVRVKTDVRILAVGEHLTLP